MATIKQVQVEAHMGERFKIEARSTTHALCDQPKTGGGEDAGPTRSNTCSSRWRDVSPRSGG